MNSLSLGFFYVCGLAWCLTECCIRAMAGNSLPAVLFLVAFVLIFSIFGCLNVSGKAVKLIESVTAIALAVSLLLFSLQTGGFMGAVKIVLSLAFILGAVVSVMDGKSAAADGGH